MSKYDFVHQEYPKDISKYPNIKRRIKTQFLRRLKALKKEYVKTLNYGGG